MRLNCRVPVGTHGDVRGRLSIYESLLLDRLCILRVLAFRQLFFVNIRQFIENAYKPFHMHDRKIPFSLGHFCEDSL